MFTGIVQTLGHITAIDAEGGKRFTLQSDLPLSALSLGASVSHSGACMTVEAARDLGAVREHRIYASPESLQLTTMDSWAVGDTVNLEPSLRLGDELGGHLVFSHVDGIGHVTQIQQDGQGWRFRFSLPPVLRPMVAKKGSVAVDGISLTVTDVDEDSFGVAIIPQTFSHTTLQHRKLGDAVNLEADMLARYVQRQLAFMAPAQNTPFS